MHPTLPVVVLLSWDHDDDRSATPRYMSLQMILSHIGPRFNKEKRLHPESFELTF